MSTFSLFYNAWPSHFSFSFLSVLYSSRKGKIRIKENKLSYSPFPQTHVCTLHSQELSRSYGTPLMGSVSCKDGFNLLITLPVLTLLGFHNKSSTIHSMSLLVKDNGYISQLHSTQHHVRCIMF